MKYLAILYVVLVAFGATIIMINLPEIISATGQLVAAGVNSYDKAREQAK